MDRKPEKPVNLPPVAEGLEWYYLKAFRIDGKLHPAFIINGEEVDGIWYPLTDEEARLYGLKEDQE